MTQAAFAALGLQDRAARPSMSRLTDYLAGKRCLLILDNCEHVLASAALLATGILHSAPDVRILATSRQALGVTGEIVVDVPTLSLPEAARPPLAEALLSDAVALFVERAQAVDRDFHLDEGNAAAVASVCAKLDGMALAIELASVRLHALGLEALEQSLTARLGVLGTGDPTRPHRQQTLDATMDWSYRLLDDTERLLWRRLSIFAGGFEGGSAAEVCSDDAVPADRIRDLVARLVERSILKRRDGPRGGRFPDPRAASPVRPRASRGVGRTHSHAEAPSGLDRNPGRRSRVRPIHISSRQSIGSEPNERTSGVRSTSVAARRARLRSVPKSSATCGYSGCRKDPQQTWTD